MIFVPKFLCMASKTGCSCSPTKHPGSFRCHSHRNSNSNSNSKSKSKSKADVVNNVKTASISNNLNSNYSTRIKSRTISNKIGILTKGNDSSKNIILLQIIIKYIHPSRHDRRRRRNFQPKPSRFFLMNCHASPRIWSIFLIIVQNMIIYLSFRSYC